MLNPSEKKFLLSLARRTLEKYLKEKTILEVDGESLPSCIFQEKRGVFVTLTKSGQLRGCIGNIEPGKPLYQGIIENTLAAALFDPRFTPVKLQELPEIKIEISILSNLKPVPEFSSYQELLDYLRQKKPGVLIKKGAHQATFLPQVWEELREPQEFLSHLCVKAGLPPQCIKESGLEIYEYQVEHFQEEDRKDKKPIE